MNIKKLTSVLTLSLVLTACSGANKTDTAPANTTNNANNKSQTNATVENNANDKAATNTASDSSSKASEQSAAQTDSLYLNNATKLTAKDAGDIFASKYPNAQIYDISYESSVFKYQVTGLEGTDEYELEINPETGDILKEKTEKEDETNFLSAEQIAKVESLLQKAIADAGASYKVDGYDLEIDDGICKLDLDLRDSKGAKIEYTFNVDTEEIIEKEQ